MTVSSGGVNNNNANYGTPSTPFGFYVNGPVASQAMLTLTEERLLTMQNTNPDFYAWVASLPNTPLPVKLLYFKVVAVDENGITLRWVTTMEKNFDHFVIERAGTDLQFVSLGVIEGKGGIDLNTTYEFVDAAPLPGKNYYRLKNVDLDRSYEYSAVIVGGWDGVNQGISLYPNPVVNRSFTLELNDVLSTPASISVLEARGYLVFSKDVSTSTSTISLPENLNAGIYFVKISSSTGQQTIRIVVNQN